MPLVYSNAAKLLDERFAKVEASFLRHEHHPKLPPNIASACDQLFASKTQAFREVLVGCTLARLQDPQLDIRLPYMNLGETAFNGRTLDEKVVNPCLQTRQVPCSKGPYLSVFRRSVTLDESTRGGVRDKISFDAFLTAISYLELLATENEITEFLDYTLLQFLKLREASDVTLNRLHRFSLDQYTKLIEKLLATPSGGRFPLFLVVAAFRAIKTHFELDWDVNWQGINVSDRSSGAGGDLVISSQGKVCLAAEITERMVDRARVVSTFNTKIGPGGIEDYLFFVLPEPAADARLQAHQYFAQGHEISFVQIQTWIVMTLATLGPSGRSTFNQDLINFLSDTNVPKALKVAWNEHTASVVGAPVNA